MFFFCLDIGTKFSPPLTVINLRRGTYGTRKVCSPNQIFFPIEVIVCVCVDTPVYAVAEI